MRIPARIALAAAIAAACGGCHSKTSFKAISNKPAPEMFSTADRGSDAAANYAYMRNTNYRSFWDDLGRALYIDQPMRLTPYPIVDAAGNPR